MHSNIHNTHPPYMHYTNTYTRTKRTHSNIQAYDCQYSSIHSHLLMSKQESKSSVSSGSGAWTPEHPEKPHHLRPSCHHTLGGPAAATAGPSHHQPNMISEAKTQQPPPGPPHAKPSTMGSGWWRREWQHRLPHVGGACSQGQGHHI